MEIDDNDGLYKPTHLATAADLILNMDWTEMPGGVEFWSNVYDKLSAKAGDAKPYKVDPCHDHELYHIAAEYVNDGMAWARQVEGDEYWSDVYAKLFNMR